MRPSYALTVLSMGILLFVSGCQLLNLVAPSNCKQGTCVKLDLTRPAKLGEDSTVTVTINSQSEAPETKVYFEFSDPDVLVDGQPTQVESRFMLKTVRVEPRQPTTVTAQVRFLKEGYFAVIAHAYTKDFRDIWDSLEVRVTPGGITPNPPPETGPGTPGTAKQFKITPTSRPATLTNIWAPTMPARP